MCNSSQHFSVLSGTDSNGRGNGIKLVGGGSHMVDNVSVGPIGEMLHHINLTLCHLLCH